MTRSDSIPRTFPVSMVSFEAITQSATAVAFILTSFVSTGLISTARALPIVAWANLGTTVLVIDDVGSFTIGGGYQYLDAKDREVLEAIDKGLAGTIDKPLTRADYDGLWMRSHHSGTLRLLYSSPERAWSASLRCQFVGRYGDEALDKNGFVMSAPPRKVLDREDEYVSGYTVVNAAVTRTFTIADHTSVSLSTGANNLFDIMNPTLIPGLVGRQFFFQAAMRFE